MTTTREGVDNDCLDLILHPSIMTPLERKAGRFMRSPDHDSGSVSDAEAAILSRWTDAGMLSEDDGGAPSRKGSRTAPEDEEDEDESNSEADDDGAQDDEDDQSGSDDDGDEDESDEEAEEASEDAVVKVTIDGETKTVSVKDLKRLYGQEASLTRKSQEVAQARKKAEDDGARYSVAMGKLMERAAERFKPYANIDWMVAQNTLDAPDFAALREEARSALADIQYLEAEVEQTFTHTQQERQTERLEEAKKAVEVLQKDIPNWSVETYNKIRAYAVDQGLPEDDINQVTNPTIIKLLHKAMSFDNASKKATTKKKATNPKNVLKSKTKKGGALGGTSDSRGFKRLQESGSKEDAAKAFLERWATDDE